MTHHTLRLRRERVRSPRPLSSHPTTRESYNMNIGARSRHSTVACTRTFSPSPLPSGRSHLTMVCSLSWYGPRGHPPDPCSLPPLRSHPRPPLVTSSRTHTLLLQRLAHHCACALPMRPRAFGSVVVVAAVRVGVHIPREGGEFGGRGDGDEGRDTHLERLRGGGVGLRVGQAGPEEAGEHERDARQR